MRTRYSQRFTLALSLVGVGCYTGAGAGSGGQGEGGDVGTSGGSGATDDGATPPATAVPIDARVRRLSAGELHAVLAELLGDDAVLPQLPPDPIVSGWDNDAASLRVNSVLAQTLWAHTPELAAQLADQRLAAAPCAGDERACAEAILVEVASQAWRRPVGADELADLLAVYDLGREGADLEAGLRLALRVVLQSPELLYRTELGDPDDAGDVVTMTDHEIAQALAFACTGRPPDAELLELAAQGSLTDPEVRTAQAERLLSSPVAASVIGDFASHWLEATDIATVDHDPALYPEWANVRASADAELREFVATAVLDDEVGFSELLLANWTVVDDTMAGFYGAAEAGRITRPAGRAAGVLALPAFLAGHAQFQDPSPVQRGHFVRTRLLCAEIPPPPNDAVVAPPPADPSLSNRERWFQKTDDPSCQGCHELMDPLGFAFENFDAAGQWRATDAGKPVDASGAIAQSDVDASFTDLEGMAALLAESDQARRCFAGHWLQYSMATALDPSGVEAIAKLVDSFASDEATVRELIVGVVAADAFVLRRAME